MIPSTDLQVEDDPSGGKLSSVNGVNGANHKMTTLINFHVGDTITALQRASLQPGGQDIILYCTAMGAIGALYPFTSREDVDFFVHLEMHLRSASHVRCWLYSRTFLHPSPPPRLCPLISPVHPSTQTQTLTPPLPSAFVDLVHALSPHN